MSVPRPQDLCVGDLCKLTEFVETKEVSMGNFFLVSKESYSIEYTRIDYSSAEDGEEPGEETDVMYQTVLGFAKNKANPAHIFLVEGQVAWGDRAWRRSFKVNNYWEMYCPAGGVTWNLSSVGIEKVAK